MHANGRLSPASSSKHLAADIDVLAVVAAQWIPAFRAALEEVLQTLRLLSSPSNYRVGAPISPASRLNTERRGKRGQALRSIAAALVRRATDLAGNHGAVQQLIAAITQTLGRLGAWIISGLPVTERGAAAKKRLSGTSAGPASRQDASAAQLDPALLPGTCAAAFRRPALAASA